MENVLSSLACNAEIKVAHFHGGAKDSMTPVIIEDVLEKLQDINCHLACLKFPMGFKLAHYFLNLNAVVI